MKFVEAAEVAAEARKVSEEEFARRHPHPGLLVEPFEADIAAALSRTEQMPTGAAARRTTLHPSARIGWIPLLTIDGHRKWPPLTFGRDASCEVQLPHKAISKKHASLRKVGDAFVVTDLHSTNGSTINDARIPPGGTAKLGADDALVLSEVVVLRVFTSPEKLYWMVHASQGNLGAPAAPATTKLIDMEGLIEHFKSLGLEASYSNRQINVAALDGRTHVRVTIEETVYSVEWGRDGAFTNRKALSISEPRAEESLKVLVLEAISGAQ